MLNELSSDFVYYFSFSYRKRMRPQKSFKGQINNINSASSFFILFNPYEYIHVFVIKDDHNFHNLQKQCRFDKTLIFYKFLAWFISILHEQARLLLQRLPFLRALSLYYFGHSKGKYQKF